MKELEITPQFQQYMKPLSAALWDVFHFCDKQNSLRYRIYQSLKNKGLPAFNEWLVNGKLIGKSLIPIDNIDNIKAMFTSGVTLLETLDDCAGAGHIEKGTDMGWRAFTPYHAIVSRLKDDELTDISVEDLDIDVHNAIPLIESKDKIHNLKLRVGSQSALHPMFATTSWSNSGVYKNRGMRQVYKNLMELEHNSENSPGSITAFKDSRNQYSWNVRNFVNNLNNTEALYFKTNFDIIKYKAARKIKAATYSNNSSNMLTKTLFDVQKIYQFEDYFLSQPAEYHERVIKRADVKDLQIGESKYGVSTEYKRATNLSQVNENILAETRADYPDISDDRLLELCNDRAEYINLISYGLKQKESKIIDDTKGLLKKMRDAEKSADDKHAFIKFDTGMNAFPIDVSTNGSLIPLGFVLTDANYRWYVGCQGDIATSIWHLLQKHKMSANSAANLILSLMPIKTPITHRRNNINLLDYYSKLDENDQVKELVKPFMQDLVNAGDGTVTDDNKDTCENFYHGYSNINSVIYARDERHSGYKQRALGTTQGSDLPEFGLDDTCQAFYDQTPVISGSRWNTYEDSEGVQYGETTQYFDISDTKLTNINFEVILGTTPILPGTGSCIFTNLLKTPFGEPTSTFETVGELEKSTIKPKHSSFTELVIPLGTNMHRFLTEFLGKIPKDDKNNAYFEKAISEAANIKSLFKDYEGLKHYIASYGDTILHSFGYNRDGRRKMLNNHGLNHTKVTKIFKDGAFLEKSIISYFHTPFYNYASSISTAYYKSSSTGSNSFDYDIILSPEEYLKMSQENVKNKFKKVDKNNSSEYRYTGHGSISIGSRDVRSSALKFQFLDMLDTYGKVYKYNFNENAKDITRIDFVTSLLDLPKNDFETPVYDKTFGNQHGQGYTKYVDDDAKPITSYINLGKILGLSMPDSIHNVMENLTADDCKTFLESPVDIYVFNNTNFANENLSEKTFGYDSIESSLKELSITYKSTRDDVIKTLVKSQSDTFKVNPAVVLKWGNCDSIDGMHRSYYQLRLRSKTIDKTTAPLLASWFVKLSTGIYVDDDYQPHLWVNKPNQYRSTLSLISTISECHYHDMVTYEQFPNANYYDINASNDDNKFLNNDKMKLTSYQLDTGDSVEFFEGLKEYDSYHANDRYYD